MKLKSLPFLKKVFDASLGGEWFIGPKLSAEVKIDLSQFNVLRAGEHWATKPTAGYSVLKGTKLSLSLLDADYEISAEVATLVSPKKKWTLADGTFSRPWIFAQCPSSVSATTRKKCELSMARAYHAAFSPLLQVVMC